MLRRLFLRSLRSLSSLSGRHLVPGPLLVPRLRVTESLNYSRMWFQHLRHSLLTHKPIQDAHARYPRPHILITPSHSLRARLPPSSGLSPGYDLDRIHEACICPGYHDVSESPMTYPVFHILRLASFIIIYDYHNFCSCGFQTRSPFTNFTNVHSDFHGIDFQRLRMEFGARSSIFIICESLIPIRSHKKCTIYPS